MNIFQSLLNFFKKLFGGSSEPARPKPADSRGASKPVTPKPDVAPTPPEEKPKPAPVKHIPIDANTAAQTLLLGHYDQGVAKDYIASVLKFYHGRFGADAKLDELRQSDLFDWVKIKQIEGTPVKTLQAFLINVGFLPPDSKKDGFFGYATQAAVRLFQEYERVYGDHPDMVPDGIVGPNTWKVIQEWQKANKTADKWLRGAPGPEYKKWIKMLNDAKAHYLEESHPILDKVNAKVAALNKNAAQAVDTFAVKDWNFPTDEIHLIGIRRGEDVGGRKRENDDAFILLINGLVFKFWGSTDPKKHAARKDEAFLVEGQHKFRFGWHNVSKSKKLYQGLNPYERGVLVFRDADNDDKLTQKDIDEGIDDEPNTTINIHWTGEGHGPSGTWSEGCQVIAGHSYIDNQGKTQNCAAFAAAGTADIQNNKENRIRKTKGAYNVFTDLVLLYAPRRVDYLLYTLGRDDTLSIDVIANLGGENLLAGIVDKFDLSGDMA